ncbi:hypothetical protein WH87_07235 [Devosia epidermidihirudinis]|uniref:Uncharacterized protein n=2 Tax=Devosia epidermidihirudinis TaxID=1293439 RepID=A0A0F5QFC2_9HYPH|nr:hypothetical protein WH87_07235 [Devosia epidermidihirudinis]
MTDSVPLRCHTDSVWEGMTQTPTNIDPYAELDNRSDAFELAEEFRKRRPLRPRPHTRGGFPQDRNRRGAVD